MTGATRRHQSFDFGERATSAPAMLGGETHNFSRNRAHTQVLLQARKLCVYEVAHRSLVPSGVISTPNPPTNIVGFRGFDTNIILNLRGGIPRPMGNLPESLSQAMLVGIMLVGKSGVNVTQPWGDVVQGEDLK